MKIVNYLMLILCANTALIQQQNVNNNQQQSRQLNAFYYGGYHPFYPFPQTHQATIQTKYPDRVQTINSNTHVQPHYPIMGPYGISPYLGMGHINPFLSNPHFFAMNYMMNPMMMNPYQINPFNMMQGMQHTTIEEVEPPKKKDEEKEEENQDENPDENKKENE